MSTSLSVTSSSTRPSYASPSVTHIGKARANRESKALMGTTSSFSSSTDAQTHVGSSLSQSQALATSSITAEDIEEVNMTISRDELNSKLAQNKAEVESVASAMRTEMANFRTAYVESFKDISITLNKLDAKSDATEKRLTQAQWIVSLVISISAVTLSAVIYFSNKSNTKPVQQQPAVVVNTQAPAASSNTTPSPQNK